MPFNIANLSEGNSPASKGTSLLSSSMIINPMALPSCTTSFLIRLATVGSSLAQTTMLPAILL